MLNVDDDKILTTFKNIEEDEEYYYQKKAGSISSIFSNSSADNQAKISTTNIFNKIWNQEPKDFNSKTISNNSIKSIIEFFVSS